MRRKDREVTDFNQIADILRRAETIRLGMNGSPYPYVVPVNFGFEASDGKLTIYFHGAKEGLKHDLIREDPHVCVEAGIFHQYASIGNDITTVYESVIGFGIAEIIEGEEGIRAMDIMLDHCGYAGFDYDKSALSRTGIYKIELESFTGKRRSL